MKKIIAILACCVLLLSMSACFMPKTLEEYFDSPTAQRQMNEEIVNLKMQNPGTFSEVSYEVYDNTLIYKFKYAQTLEMTNTAQGYLNVNMDAALDTLGNDLKSATDFENITVGVELYNGDGSLLYELKKDF